MVAQAVSHAEPYHPEQGDADGNSSDQVDHESHNGEQERGLHELTIGLEASPMVSGQLTPTVVVPPDQPVDRDQPRQVPKARDERHERQQKCEDADHEHHKKVGVSC